MVEGTYALIKNFYRLNLDTNCFKDSLDFDSFLHKIKTREFVEPTLYPYNLKKENDLISKDWLEYMKDIGLEPRSLIFFYREENYQHWGAHIDLNDSTGENDRVYAVNWTIDPEDQSEMTWYNLPENWREQVEYSMIGSAYAEWPIETLTEVGERCTIGTTPTLVRTDIPHTVFMKDNFRLCLSFRFDLKFHDWNAVTNYFNPYFL